MKYKFISIIASLTLILTACGGGSGVAGKDAVENEIDNGPRINVGSECPEGNPLCNVLVESPNGEHSGGNELAEAVKIRKGRTFDNDCTVGMAAEQCSKTLIATGGRGKYVWEIKDPGGAEDWLLISNRNRSGTAKLKNGRPLIASDARTYTIKVKVADYETPSNAKEEEFQITVIGPPPLPVSTCGNGTIESPETCDDGNIANGDGCSAACTIESSDRTVPPNNPIFVYFTSSGSQGLASANANSYSNVVISGSSLRMHVRSDAGNSGIKIKIDGEEVCNGENSWHEKFDCSDPQEGQEMHEDDDAIFDISIRPQHFNRSIATMEIKIENGTGETRTIIFTNILFALPADNSDYWCGRRALGYSDVSVRESEPITIEALQTGGKEFFYEIYGKAPFIFDKAELSISGYWTRNNDDGRWVYNDGSRKAEDFFNIQLISQYINNNKIKIHILATPKATLYAEWLKGGISISVAQTIHDSCGENRGVTLRSLIIIKNDTVEIPRGSLPTSRVVIGMGDTEPNTKWEVDILNNKDTMIAKGDKIYLTNGNEVTNMEDIGDNTNSSNIVEYYEHRLSVPLNLESANGDILQMQKVKIYFSHTGSDFWGELDVVYFDITIQTDKWCAVAEISGRNDAGHGWCGQRSTVLGEPHEYSSDTGESIFNLVWFAREGSSPCPLLVMENVSGTAYSSNIADIRASNPPIGDYPWWCSSGK